MQSGLEPSAQACPGVITGLAVGVGATVTGGVDGRVATGVLPGRVVTVGPVAVVEVTAATLVVGAPVVVEAAVVDDTEEVEEVERFDGFVVDVPAASEPPLEHAANTIIKATTPTNDPRLICMPGQ